MSNVAHAESATLNMVQGQIAPNGVTNDDVLSAFLSVDRASFAPEGFTAHALCDTDLVVDGQLVLLNPLTVAWMVQALAEQETRGSVAVIGDHTGYVVELLRTMGFAALPVTEESVLLNGGPWQGIILHGSVSEIPAFLFPYVDANGLVLGVRQADGALMGDVLAVSPNGGSRLLGQAGAPRLAAFIKAAGFSL